MPDITVSNNVDTFLQAADFAGMRTTLGVDASGTDNSTDVTLTGTGTYISLSGQEITVDPITVSDITDFDTEVSNNSSVAANTAKLTCDTTNVTAAGALMDSEVDADIKTFSLPANTTISTFGASLVDDLSASSARTTLGVDPAGTDNSTDVTLAGTGTYISLSGQEITVDPITESDIADLGDYVDKSSTETIGGDKTFTGDLTVDTSTLKVDSTNNRVGIGTATPAAGYSLDVVGNTKINGYLDLDRTVDIYLGEIPGTPSFSGLWFAKNSSTATASNYSFLGDANNTFLNGPITLHLRTGNTTRATIGADGIELAAGDSVSFASNSGTWDGAALQVDTIDETTANFEPLLDLSTGYLGRYGPHQINFKSGTLDSYDGSSFTASVDYNNHDLYDYSGNKVLSWLNGLEVATGQSIDFADNSGSWDGATIGGAQTFASTVDVTGRLDANGGLQTNNITNASNSNDIDVSNGQMTSDTYFATSIDWNIGVLYDMTTGNASIDYRNKELEHSGSVVASWGASGFNVSGGDLTVDTSTLKVDSTNNRVGIGDAAPDYPLHLKGTGTSTAVAFGLHASDDTSRFEILDNGSWVTKNSAGSDKIKYDVTGYGGGGLLNLISSRLWCSNILVPSGAMQFGTGGSNTSDISFNSNGAVAFKIEGTTGNLEIATTNSITFADNSGSWNGATIAGAQSFTGQVEATGQAASTDDSVMTRALTDTHSWLHSARLWSPSYAASFSNSGTGSYATTSPADFWAAAYSGTSNSGYGQALIARGLNATPGASGAGIAFSRELGVSIRVQFYNAGTTSSNVIRLVVGDSSGAPTLAGSDPISDDGLGVEFRKNGANTEWRVFGHDGTTFTASTWTVLYAGIHLSPANIAVYSDGSGNITAYHAKFGDNNYDTITTTGGPTTTGASTTSYVAVQAANTPTGTDTAQIRVYAANFFTP